MYNETDQLNCTLSLDNEIAEQLKNLAPHKSTFDLNAPRMVSKNLSMPKPVVATIAGWLHGKDTRVDAEKEFRMSQIPTV